MGQPGEAATPDPGTPGASGRKEHARRKANREARAREKHPHIGGLLLALQDEPQHQQAWAQGAAGEQRVARSLAKYVSGGVVLLHDRSIPDSGANIDHIAIAPSAKRINSVGQANPETVRATAVALAAVFPPR